MQYSASSCTSHASWLFIASIKGDTKKETFSLLLPFSAPNSLLCPCQAVHAKPVCLLCSGLSQDVLHEENGEGCNSPQEAPQPGPTSPQEPPQPPQQGGTRCSPTIAMQMGHFLIGQREMCQQESACVPPTNSGRKLQGVLGQAAFPDLKGIWTRVIPVGFVSAWTPRPSSGG